jgi:hypothetical protein
MPVTVATRSPVRGKLTGRKELPVGASKERLPTTVPTEIPTVRSNESVLLCPARFIQHRDVLLVQLAVLHCDVAWDCPIPTVEVGSKRAKLSPPMPISVLPVAAELPGVFSVSTGASKVNEPGSVEMAMPTVKPT